MVSYKNTVELSLLGLEVLILIVVDNSLVPASQIEAALNRSKS